jgi:hypothetical protein
MRLVVRIQLLRGWISTRQHTRNKEDGLFLPDSTSEFRVFDGFGAAIESLASTGYCEIEDQA